MRAIPVTEAEGDTGIAAWGHGDVGLHTSSPRRGAGPGESSNRTESSPRREAGPGESSNRTESSPRREAGPGESSNRTESSRQARATAILLYYVPRASLTATNS